VNLTEKFQLETNNSKLTIVYDKITTTKNYKKITTKMIKIKNNSKFLKIVQN